MEWDWEQARRHCYREARKVLAPDAAEDAAQEAVVRGWRYRSSCREPDRYLAWFGQIARREALRIRSTHGGQVSLDEAPEAGEDPTLPAMAGIDLQRLLRGLDPADALLLRLRYEADLTYEAAAEVLGMPIGTAKVRVHRLRARLRDRLEDTE